MSYLPEYYKEQNYLSGHGQSCGWGAGADCCCGKFNREAGHAMTCGYGMNELCDCGKEEADFDGEQLAAGREAFETEEG